MKEKRKQDIFNNRAVSTGQAEDVTSCESCNEMMVFAMRDKYHEFSIGLQTILECLRIAEQEGYVPQLPPEWWNATYEP